MDSAAAVPALPALSPLWRTALLALAIALLFAPFADGSRYLARWDSAQYALALDHYDVRDHQPHPPGYPAYVGAAKLLRPVAGGDANRTYLLLNLLLTAGAAWALYLLGRAWGGPLAGATATLCYLASPLTLYYSAVALSYPAGACWFTWLGWAVWRVRHEDDPRWWWPFAIAGIGGAFRLPSLILGLPLLLYLLLHLPWRARFGGLLLLALVPLAAYWPVWQASGGFSEWLAAVRSEGVKHEVRLARFDYAPVAEFRANWQAMAQFFWQGYLLPVPVLLVAALAVLARRMPALVNELPRLPFAFLLWWVLPGVLFYLIIHVNFAGVFLDYSPAVALVLGFGSTRVTGQRPVMALVFTGLMVALLVGRYWTADRSTDLSRPLLKAVDELMTIHVQDIPAAAPPAQTLILTGETFKQDAYYLPGYRIVWDKYLLRVSSPVAQPILTMQGHRLEPWVLPGERREDGITRRYLALPEGTRWMIVTHEVLGALDPAQQPLAEPVSERSAEVLARIPVEDFTGLIAVAGYGWQLVPENPWE